MDREEQEVVSDATALPKMSIRFVGSLIAAVVAVSFFYYSTTDVARRQAKYIDRDAESHLELRALIRDQDEKLDLLCSVLTVEFDRDPCR